MGVIESINGWKSLECSLHSMMHMRERSEIE